MSKKVLISGGSGLVGSRLTTLLLQRNYRVAILSRRPEKIDNRTEAFKWDIEKGFIDPEAFEDTQFLIHLAGADVAEKRWTERRKKEILKSRTSSARLLHNWLNSHDHSVRTYISPSGISYYGSNSNHSVQTEDSSSSDDFLAEVTKAWEKSAEEIAALGIRTVTLRIGIALSTNGGALKALANPVKLGFGAPLGTGEQIMSWIHIDDLCRIIIFALEYDKLSGVYNAVAPNPVSNWEFMQKTANTLNRPSFLPPVPGFALKLIMGERASIVLDGANVSSQKIEDAGFTFDYPTLKVALKDLFNK